MSIVYDMEEHMVLGKRSTDSEYYSILGGHIAMLGAMMLCRRIRFCSLHVSTDRGNYEFDGAGVTEELQKIADVTDCAERMDFSACYEYTAYADDVVCELGSPEAICRYLQEEDGDLPETVFYCLYSEADCDTTIGHLQAYGTWQGRKYSGEVEYADLQEIPDGFSWRTPQTAVTLEMDWTPDSDRAAVEKICRELCTLSEADTLEITDRNISFFLNNVLLKNRGDVQKYFALCDQLAELAEEGPCCETEFVSEGSVNPRILKADFVDGDWKFRMTTV